MMANWRYKAIRCTHFAKTIFVLYDYIHSDADRFETP